MFAEPLVEPARAYFASLWAQPVAITAKPEQSALLLYSTLSETLHESPLFPGGYKQLTDVVPGRIWLAWKYVRPGETMGMAYDGLVWLDDRFAWFPKAWRLLKKPSDPFYVD